MSFAIFMSAHHGDLIAEWDENNHAAIVERIQALMDKGVTFHKLDTKTTGKNRQKTTTTAVPITRTTEIGDTRKLLVRDQHINDLIEGGVASLARLEGVSNLETAGVVTSAAEAATTDTVAVQPAKGG